MVLLAALLALAGPFLPLADPLATDVARALQPPGVGAPFGTDHLGRDLLARVVFATRLDLGLAFLAVMLALVLGCPAGVLAGWVGGWVGRGAGILVDVLLALPIYLLAMVLTVRLGNSLAVVVIATALVNLPFFIRLTRLEVARRRCAVWVDMARMGGMAERLILMRFVLPGVLPLVAVQATTMLGWAVLNAAGLSFIGIGVRPPAPEWGVLVAEGARFLSAGAWWLVAFPALALVLTVLGFHMAGDGLRRRLGRQAA